MEYHVLVCRGGLLEAIATYLLFFEIRIEEEYSSGTGQLLGQVFDCRKSRVARGREVAASSGLGRPPVGQEVERVAEQD